MSDLSAIINSANSAYSQQAAASGGSDLNQGDFLRLMATQLQSQDPSQPMDPSSFFNQLTQFSMVSGMQGLQSSFNALAQTLSSEQNSIRAGDVLGHKVMFASDKGVLDANGMQGAVSVPKDATSVTLQIKDAGGNVVRSIQLPTSAGTADFSWDGRGDDGSTLPPGPYTLSASASVDGAAQSATTYAVASVQGVTLGAGGSAPMIDLGALGQISLAQVFQIL
jgi:flagellar basal-body rod modification protein FlgD